MRLAIRIGKQAIRIIVPRESARASIDPWRKLIDRDGDDNLVEVKSAEDHPVGAGS